MSIWVDGEASAGEKDAEGSLPILSPETQVWIRRNLYCFSTHLSNYSYFFVVHYRAPFIVVLKFSPTNGLERIFCALLIVSL